MKFKKISSILLSTIILSIPVTSFAGVQLTIDSQPITFTQASPIILDGTTLVPLRGVLDKIGFDIQWDAQTKTATLINGDIIITAREGFMQIGNDVASDINPQLIDGYFMVPVRAIAQSTGASVEWNQETKTVTINTVGDTKEEPVDKSQKAPEGKMTVIDTDYLKAIFEAIPNIKENSKDTALAYFLDVSNADTFKNDKIPEDVILTLSTINSLNPPVTLSKVQEDIKQYIKLCNSVIQISKEDISDKEIINKIDKLKEDKKELASTFGVNLYQYFKTNDVYFEKVYGETVLDILN